MDFVEQIAQINKAINDFVWVKVGLILLIGTGILMTVLTKFFQVVHIKEWWMKTIGGMFSRHSKVRKNKELVRFLSFRRCVPLLQQP